MVKMISRALLCLLLLIARGIGQVSVTDASASGSPLAWSGVATNLTVKNVASKEILCYVAKVRSLTIRKDYYFKTTGLAPGTIIDPIDLTAVSASFAAATSLTANTLYVQFVDGTQWGDRSAWRSTRNEINVLLANLSAAYTQRGYAGLTDTLQQVVDGQDYGNMMKFVAAHLSMLGSDEDRLAEINSRIASAAKHEQTLAGGQ